MLTAKQKELLLLIHDRLAETGVPPSFEEMKDALDLKSKSGIHRLITALEERGFIRRLPHRARALEVVKLPENIQNGAVAGAIRTDTSTARVVQTRSVDDTGPDQQTADDGAVDVGMAKRSANRPGGLPLRLSAAEPFRQPSMVPLMGRIAAGVPISAIQDHSRDIEVPTAMLGPGDHFALEVRGDSMIEAGIQEGDLVVIRRTAVADNGTIVVALVEGEEATLKRLRRKGGTVALEAANPLYETRIFRADQVDVQGQLVGLLRRY